ncbi:MAG: DNA translocase FtsK [Bacteroidales bacterium]|nr:DNA translocase FtsK [Bacteroidales bacterium]
MPSASAKPQGNTLKKEDKKPRAKRSVKNPFAFLRTERSRRTIGLFLIFFGLYLLVSLVSYLMHWKEDDSIRMGLWDALRPSSAVPGNIGGRLGHLLGYVLVKQGFGVASFLLSPWLVLLGIKEISGISVLPLARTTRHILAGLIWLSTALAFALESTDMGIFGGGTGIQLNAWLQGVLGAPGTFIVLVFILGSYLVISWNIPWEKLFKRRSEPAGKEDLAPAYVGNVKTARELAEEDQDNDIPDEPSTEEEEDDEPVEFILSSRDENPVKPSVPPVIPLADDDIEMTIEQPAVEDKALSVEPRERHGIGEQYDPTLDLPSYQRPTMELLSDYATAQAGVNEAELKANKERIVTTLLSYGIQIEKIKATIGPTITLYEIVPAPGIRISKIKNLADDIALSLSAIGIRIIAPLPGKGTIGIEVPNQKPETVSIKSILSSDRFLNSGMELPIGLGKTISNESYIADLTRMPHLLVAGATGQGKSVGLNAVITSLLYSKHPAELKFVMVDPKKVELTLFSRIERHFLAKLPDAEEAIITDTRSVVRTLNSLGIEMDMRYTLLNAAQVRNIKEYNKKFLTRTLNPNDGHRFLPYLVVVIDEFADLIMTAGKEVEYPLTRLAQLARAIGIHLVIATQRPSTNIITGTIKANFPARIAFRVISQIDSRTILDSTGANHLIGRGDMLLSTGSDLIRLQCAFVDTPEVERVTDFIGSQRGYPDAHYLPEYLDENDEANKELDPSDRDELFDEAAMVIVQHQHGSTSLLQRKLKLGYNRAGRLIDQLEAAGIVGPFEGSKAREVKFKDILSLEQYLKQLDQESKI